MKGKEFKKFKLTYNEAKLLGQFIIAGVMTMNGECDSRDPFRPFSHFAFVQEQIGRRNWGKAAATLEDKKLISTVYETSGRPIGYKCEAEGVALECYDLLCSGFEPRMVEKIGGWPQ